MTESIAPLPRPLRRAARAFSAVVIFAAKAGRGPHQAKSIGRVLFKALGVFVVSLGVHEYLQHVPLGTYFRNFEYAILQSALRSEFAVTRPLRQKDRHILPVIVDLVQSDRSQPTNRKMLDELILTLTNMKAAAIGIDIDFSPDDGFITTEDGKYFDRWQALHNVRLGVFRREGETPSRWLGHADFRELAAGIMLPESESGYAYLFSSPDLKKWRELDHADNYLLQMPAALHAITHPKARLDIVEDPYVKPLLKDDSGASVGDSRNARIRVGQYPIDYSFHDFIERIPYQRPSDLARWSDRIEGRIVLVGDTHDTDDSRAVPGFDMPVSGVMIHAAALATLNQGLLHYIDDDTGRIVEFILLLGVLFVMGAVHYLKATRERWRDLNETTTEIISSWSAGGFVFAASIVFVGWTHFFWPDFLWLTAGFLLHPYLQQLFSVFLKSVRAVVGVSART